MVEIDVEVAFTSKGGYAIVQFHIIARNYNDCMQQFMDKVELYSKRHDDAKMLSYEILSINDTR